jgi:hypothetical protein
MKQVSKRQELLLKLKEYVEQDKNIAYLYATQKEEETCYCALGYLGHLCNVDDEILIAYKSKAIKYFRKNSHMFNALLEHFTVVELVILQELNDKSKSNNWSEEDRLHYKQDLLEEIDSLINEENIARGGH